MPSFTFFTAAIALAAGINANPIEKHDAFSVHQVEHGKILKNGPAEIAKTMRKYGKAVPAHILAAAAEHHTLASAQATDFQAGKNGSVSATPADRYDSSYLSPVTIGKIKFNLLFDTGSADLWVFSDLQARYQLAGHDYYKVDSAKQKPDYNWRISYGDGSGASGKVYTDKVTVGRLTAPSQAVEAAQDVSDAFLADQDTDGILGLGLSSLNAIEPIQQKTWFDTIAAALARPIFAIKLKHHAPGSYDFGFVDKSATGLHTTPARTADGFWGFRSSAYTVGAVGTGSETPRSIDAILDSGTSLIYLPQDVVGAYYAQIPSARPSERDAAWVVPCDAVLPDFSIRVVGDGSSDSSPQGGFVQTVPGEYILYGPTGSGGGDCFGGIQESGGLDVNIFGDIFFKGKYIVHGEIEKGKGLQLGFARQK